MSSFGRKDAGVAGLSVGFGNVGKGKSGQVEMMNGKLLCDGFQRWGTSSVTFDEHSKGNWRKTQLNAEIDVTEDYELRVVLTGDGLVSEEM